MQDIADKEKDITDKEKEILALYLIYFCSRVLVKALRKENVALLDNGNTTCSYD